MKLIENRLFPFAKSRAFTNTPPSKIPQYFNTNEGRGAFT